MGLRPGIALILIAGISARGQTLAAETDLLRIEKAVAVAEGELRRIEDQHRTVPDLFTVDDRSERMTWGEIYYLTKEYQRATMLLFGAVEPRDTDREPAERRPGYADGIYHLADSLFLLGNFSAAQSYFEELLKLRGHRHHEQATLRLMEMGDAQRRFEDVDRYYADYLKEAPRDIPGKVRYLRGKSLFLAKRDRAAIDELSKVPASDAFSLRARYLIGAALVRAGKTDEALTMFTTVAFAKAIAAEDKSVKEQGHLARGRLLYEVDRLAESIDAYAEIGYDSPLLTTMLYEVTWTYVRRGQLAVRGRKGDQLTELARHELAKREYEKALDQLEELRALQPASERSAEIDILAGNLRLQRNELEKAEEVFEDVLKDYRNTEAQLEALMAEHSAHERLLADVLAISGGGLTVDSKLPPLAAQRVARNEEVAKVLQVFKDIQKSRDDVASTMKLLEELEEQLSPDNPTRTELFLPLQAAVDGSASLDNTLLGIKQQAIAIERKTARPRPQMAQRMESLRLERDALEAKVALLPRSPAAMAARKKGMFDRLSRIDNALHQAELEVRHRRAELTAIDFMHARDPSAGASALRVGLRENQLREARAGIETIERIANELRGRVVVIKKGIATAGGRGSSEDALRTAYARSVAEERAVLASVRDPVNAQVDRRVDRALEKVDELTARNAAFRSRLDGIVQDRLLGARALLRAEREALASYLGALDDIDKRAASVRDTATVIALEKVRKELNRIVLRADVGILDTSFARKQAETNKIGQLQRARAAELTGLTQAYADLTRDEAP
jgi:tetratricopeptide (TPR) repeat protein